VQRAAELARRTHRESKELPEVSVVAHADSNALVSTQAVALLVPRPLPLAAVSRAPQLSSAARALQQHSVSLKLPLPLLPVSSISLGAAPALPPPPLHPSTVPPLTPASFAVALAPAPRLTPTLTSRLLSAAPKAVLGLGLMCWALNYRPVALGLVLSAFLLWLRVSSASDKPSAVSAAR
jgi:hypothetical protein